MDNVKLNNGVEMPILGFGVYQIDNPEECERSVLDALEIGYRSIDTAQAYYNEEAVGKAIIKSAVPRKDLFITSKIWISNANYEKAQASIEESLNKLQLDYLDLMLIHQPFNDYYGAYRAMEDAYKAKKIRAIGVSNFYPDRLIDICNFVEIPPAINQVETHVFNQQVEAHGVMAKYKVQHQSWGPFAEGRNNMFSNPTLSAIGVQYGKSVAQVALRYLIERGVVVIPKSTHKERIAQNFDVFDFSLSPSDMQKILALDQAKSSFFSHYDAKTAEFMTSMGKAKS